MSEKGTFWTESLYYVKLFNSILNHAKDRDFYEVVMEERKEEDARLTTGNLKRFPEEPFIAAPRKMLEIISKNQ